VAKIGLFMDYIKQGKLSISKELLDFVNNELLPGTNIKSENFWLGLDETAHELSPINKKLLSIRSEMQKKIDDWHIKEKGKELDLKNTKTFKRKWIFS
jgi:Malate synthase